MGVNIEELEAHLQKVISEGRIFAILHFLEGEPKCLVGHALALCGYEPPDPKTEGDPEDTRKVPVPPRTCLNPVETAAVLGLKAKSSKSINNLPKVINNDQNETERSEAWKKLWTEGYRLIAEGNKLRDEVRKRHAEGERSKAWEAREKLCAEGNRLYVEMVTVLYGEGAVINWETGNVTPK